jgi:hypothetical protein
MRGCCIESLLMVIALRRGGEYTIYVLLLSEWK